MEDLVKDGSLPAKPDLIDPGNSLQLEEGSYGGEDNET
jgi:hypothetical protein